MNLLSWTFLVFAGLSVAVYQALPTPRMRQAALVGATLVWFAFGVWWHALVAIAMATTTWLFGRWMLSRPEEKRGVVLALGVASFVGYFVLFRYLALWTGFDPATGAGLRWWMPNPLLAPLGLSFMMFEGIAHLADLYLGRSEDPGSWWSHIVFNLFYPTRVIGPLRRHEEFTRDINGPTRLDPDDVAWAARRVLLGVAKKALVANPLGAFALFNLHPSLIAAGARVPLLLGAVLYWAYLFFDLSGYSDIVIGLSRLFGVRVPENFNRPYVADNISDYWQRWHISLSAWVRDYVFNPLAIRWRGWNYGAPLAAFSSMVILGLWHGLELRYLIFGVWHGALLGGYMVYRQLFGRKPWAKKLAKSKLWSAAGWCFVVVNAVLTHVLFAVSSAAMFVAWLRAVVGR
ncbi:MAG: algI1 [Myxococcaceae bacterium]|nr:algI1 [Myxococcaceae bacterium]